MIKKIVAMGIAFILCACQAAGDSREVLEQANLEKAIYCMELLEITFDIETADRECFAPTYIQHSPHVPDGRDAVIAFFTERMQKYPQSRIEIKRGAADGDLVWLHLHSMRTPDALGSAVIHIFRMEDGKFAEHWGVGTPVKDDALHDNGMF